MARKQQTTVKEAEPQENDQVQPDDQLDSMSDLVEMFEGEPAEQPADAAPAKESDKDQPGAAEKAKDTPAKDPATESLPPKDGEEEPGEKPIAKEDRAAADTGKDEDDPTFEVVHRDGVRKVPLKNLITTYQQHQHLQEQHGRVKSFFDLSKNSQIPVEDLFNYTVLGIQTAYANQKSGGQPGAGIPSPGLPAGDAQGYQGPFESKEQEDNIKETDPVVYRVAMNAWNTNRQLTGVIQQLQQKLTENGQGRPQEAAQRQDSSVDADRQRLAGIFDGFHKTHDDYFKKHPDRADGFKRFVYSTFGNVPLDKVNEQFLNLAMGTFDPDYYARFSSELSAKEAAQRRADENAAFGETDSVRSRSAGKHLTEQQEHMADLIDTDW